MLKHVTLNPIYLYNIYIWGKEKKNTDDKKHYFVYISLFMDNKLHQEKIHD